MMLPEVAGHDDEPLCCCQFRDASGDTNCLLLSCCDCETFDSMCDRCCRCKGIRMSDIDQFLKEMDGRIRFPMCLGKGAVQLKWELVGPVAMIILGMIVGSFGPFCLFFVFVIFSMTILVYYNVWKQRPIRTKTKFFYSWAMTSVLLVFYVSQLIVVYFREILFWENVLLSVMFAIMMYTFTLTRRDPGSVLPSKRATASNQRLQDQDSEHSTGVNNTVGHDWTYGSSIEREESVINMNGYQKIAARSLVESDVSVFWCDPCKSDMPVGATHCFICGVCVLARDHHCIWIDNCVGQNNHRSFIICLIMSILCGIYGSHLTLTTVCTPEMYYDWFLFPADCRLVHLDIVSGLGYACAIYASTGVSILILILLYQVLLISQNVTSHELKKAHRLGNVRRYFFVVSNPHSRGIYRNWRQFMSGRRRRATEL